MGGRRCHSPCCTRTSQAHLPQAHCTGVSAHTRMVQASLRMRCMPAGGGHGVQVWGEPGSCRAACCAACAAHLLHRRPLCGPWRRPHAEVPDPWSTLRIQMQRCQDPAQGSTLGIAVQRYQVHTIVTHPTQELEPRVWRRAMSAQLPAQGLLLELAACCAPRRTRCKSRMNQPRMDHLPPVIPPLAESCIKGLMWATAGPSQLPQEN